MDRTVKVAVAQFAIKKGQREANLVRFRRATAAVTYYGLIEIVVEYNCMHAVLV